MKARGFSLIEALVACAVFSLLTGIIGLVFVTAHRYSRLYQRVSQAQREVVLCLQHLGRDLNRSHADSLRPGFVCQDEFWFLTFQSDAGNPLSYDPNGQVVYREWVGIWLDPNGGLVWRGQVALNGGPKPWTEVNLALAPSSISPFQSSTRRRRLASSITQLQLEQKGKQVQINIESQTQAPGNPVTRYRVTSSFLMQ